MKDERGTVKKGAAVGRGPAPTIPPPPAPRPPESMPQSAERIIRHWTDRAIAAESQVAALSAQVEAYRALEVAARECVDAAKELRRYVSPDSGCGYFTYKRIWDSSMQAETHFVHALAALSDNS